MSNQVKLLYQYIAANDRDFAVDICRKYGYTVPPVKNYRELGGLLQQLVQYEGEPAFIEILDHHPDKDLILEQYSPTPGGGHIGCDGSNTKEKSGGCGCGGSCGGGKQSNFLNADAAAVVAATLKENNAAANNNTTSHQITSTQTGIIILSGAIIIALAIMSKK